MPSFSDLDQTKHKLLSVSNPIPKQALNTFNTTPPLKVPFRLSAKPPIMRFLQLLILPTLVFLASPAQAQFGKLLDRASDKAKSVLGEGAPLGEEKIGAGLKEALRLGVDEAVNRLAAEDGYFDSPYKILLPQEARSVVKRVSALPGFGDLEADLIQRLNRAAELAANEAGPIFFDAITGLTIQDAMGILTGADDAATRYLTQTTSPALTAAFRPIIKSSLDEVNATALWEQAATAYNQIPFTKKVNQELDVHVTDTALTGLFGLIEVKETELRNKPALRNTELLREVFARQD